MRISEALQWQPDQVSEDHIGNLLIRLLTPPRWSRAYYNPPSGSWKLIILRKGEYEYRQVGPKRGVKTIKRPDLALQDLACPTNPRLFLIEAKKARRDWDQDLPKLMKAFFVGADDGSWGGLGALPFFHRRLLGMPYERLSKNHPDCYWLKSAKMEFFFGFAYSLGRIESADPLRSEYAWLTAAASEMPPEYPTVFLAVAWSSQPVQPCAALTFSRGFPMDVTSSLTETFEPLIVRE